MEVSAVKFVRLPSQLVLPIFNTDPRRPRQCEHCAQWFMPRGGGRRYCSRSCAAKVNGKGRPAPHTSFKPGFTPWNKGKTGEQSHVFGRKFPEATKQLFRSRVGPASPGWRGGVSTENELARKRAEYFEWRRAVFERDDYTCQTCGARSAAGKRVRLQADHIKPFALYPDLRYDVSNGRTLCEPCHRKTPTYGNGSRYAKKEEETLTGSTARRAG